MLGFVCSSIFHRVSLCRRLGLHDTFAKRISGSEVRRARDATQREERYCLEKKYSSHLKLLKAPLGQLGSVAVEGAKRREAVVPVDQPDHVLRSNVEVRWRFWE
jgi:hypothetical protein